MAEVLIVTRHQGAVEFLNKHHITGRVDESFTDDNIDSLSPHSVVVGVLPLQLAIEVIQAGHRFFSLQLKVERWQRGVELSSEDMEGIASLQELQMQWRRIGGEWQCDSSECWTGVPEPSSGDFQQFRIAMVPRTAADIIAHMDSVADGCFPCLYNAARYSEQ